MSGLTKEKDSENKIDEYLTYSDVDGYTVLKSGWYFVNMSTDIKASSPADVSIYFVINENIITFCRGWSSSSIVDRNQNAFSVYLKKDDKIYFGSSGNETATSRTSSATCCPMF